MIVLLPVFIGLGFWQLDRAGQKRALASVQEARRRLPPLDLGDSVPDYGEVEYRSIVARGLFLPGKSVFIENRKHQGRAGFHVVTPMKLERSGRYLLVNRGWVPAPPDAESFETVTVTGYAVVPEPPALRLGGQLETPSKVQRWPYLTLDDYAAWSGLDIYPFVLLQSPSDSHGFVRAWVMKPVDDTMHIGYALQWFAFALIVAVFWLRLSFTKDTPMGKGT